MYVNSKKSPSLRHYCLNEKETSLKIHIDSKSYSQNLIDYSKKILLNLRSDIENYIKMQHDFLRHKRILGIYAGKNEFSYKIGLEISEEENSFGICTSSGTTGTSISLGKADAAIIKARNSTLADAVATATANIIQTPKDLEPAVKFASKIPGVKGVIAIKDEFIAGWGNMKLVNISHS